MLHPIFYSFLSFQGGRPRHNGGRRAPGGGFLTLLRQRDDVDQTALEKVISQHDITWSKNKKKKVWNQHDYILDFTILEKALEFIFLFRR